MPTKARSARRAAASDSLIEDSEARAFRAASPSTTAGASSERYYAPSRTAISRTSSWPLISDRTEERPPTRGTTVTEP